MIKVFQATGALITWPFSSILYADRAISHAPLGVMGDHTHKRGEQNTC